MHVIGRPEPSEYTPYIGKYIALVAGDDLFAAFRDETAATQELLGAVTEEKSLHRYAPGKWSIRETYVHLVHVERILGYRALRFARGDRTELPSFEPEDFVAPSKADFRSWSSIVEEYDAVRPATIALFRNLREDAWLRTGTGGGYVLSVRAVAWNILGHDAHHRTIVRERYL